MGKGDRLVTSAATRFGRSFHLSTGVHYEGELELLQKSAASWRRLRFYGSIRAVFVIITWNGIACIRRIDPIVINLYEVHVAIHEPDHVLRIVVKGLVLFAGSALMPGKGRM